ncbi:MAG: hypothetical protein R3E65_05490 [Steroidobacteraceae bacterium]
MYHQIATLGRRDIVWAPDARTGFGDDAVAHVAFRPWFDSGDGGRAQRNGAGGVLEGGAGPNHDAARSAARAAAGDRVAAADTDAWIALLPQLELGVQRAEARHHCAQ